MSDVTSLFNNSELALAAYAVLQKGANAGANIVALTGESGAGMFLTEAIEFAKRFPTVVTQYDDITAPGGMYRGRCGCEEKKSTPVPLGMHFRQERVTA